MDIHEYQAKKILSSFGIGIPRGGIAYSPENAEYKAREIGGSKWVVKAQVHSGGRGKAGGVILCDSELEVAQATDKLLGKKLVTNQTGPNGKIINRVYIEEATDIKKELYLGLVFDRSSECIMVVASTEGGMSVEEISKEKPETIIRSKIEVAVGMQKFQAREIAFGLGIEPKLISRTAEAIIGCYRAFSELDATMVEINPLAISKQEQILALDCKMSFDNNALFRRNQVSELRDKSQENSNEVYASDRGLNYISLEGNIGNIINGAGLAMASMDMIKLAGAEPANFLDVGGGATPEKIEALRDDMGLDEPFIIQYLIYIKNALGGDFGESYVFHGKKVTELLIPKLLVSIKLNIAVTIVSISLGVPLGFYAAKNYGSWKDPTIVLTCLLYTSDAADE